MASKVCCAFLATEDREVVPATKWGGTGLQLLAVVSPTVDPARIRQSVGDAQLLVAHRPDWAAAANVAVEAALAGGADYLLLAEPGVDVPPDLVSGLTGEMERNPLLAAIGVT